MGNQNGQEPPVMPVPMPAPLASASSRKLAPRKKIGFNAAGYECPRFNLESQRMLWLKNLRSAGSRAAANAIFNSPSSRDAYTTLAGPERILVSMYEMEIPGLPGELAGLRLIQLTDIHHGPWLPIEFVEAMVEKVNDLKPDIIALTGDYVINSHRYIQPVAEALGRLQPSIGSVAVLGNHDWWEGADQVRAAFRRQHIPFIDNSSRIVTPDRKLRRKGDRGLCLAGVGDPWGHKVDFDKALSAIPRAMPRIVLSHNPDCAEDPRLLAANHRIDLMLSGHTHGGQICFPRKLTPILPRMRRSRYARGLVQGPICPVFVSRGLGTAGFPFRMGADPEMAVFDLAVTEEGAGGQER